MKNNIFIYLIGLPGSGKLTIAKALQKKLPSILIDNHYINNVVFGLIDTDGVTSLPEKVWEQTDAVRKIVFDTIRELSKPERNFIFTNALVENVPGDRGIYEEVVKLAKDRKAFLLPVRILVSREVLCERVVSHDRKLNLKSINPIAAAKCWDENEVLVPEDGFTLDTSELSAKNAADAIYLELKKRLMQYKK